ncbi:MAG TPA: TetR/AcrR family transcriptional regulator [Candidatus Acidoferrum sp.]|nr:TetR/AcrR family transcriptional regulator [Candidatus Acidoferrum sp.]
MSSDMREAIVRTVKRLYSRYSYDEISLSQIMREGGIGKGALYWHFPNKEAMFEAVFRQCYDEAVAATREGVVDGAGACECLKQRLLGLLALDGRDPEALSVVRKHIKRMAQDEVESPFPYGAFKEDMLRHIRAGLAAGELAPLPESMLLMLAHLHNSELIAYVREHPEYRDRPEELDRIIDRLFRSLVP